MNIDQAHHAFEVIIRATAGTARSSIIGLVLLAIGSPLALVFSVRFGRDKLTAPLAVVCGLFVLSVVSWYTFRLAISVKLAYLVLIILGIGVSSTMFARSASANGARRTVRRILPTVLSSAAAFIIPVFICNALSFAKIKSGAMPLLSTGNNDIFAYLKIGDVLLALPGVDTMVAGGDITVSDVGRVWGGQPRVFVFLRLAYRR